MRLKATAALWSRCRGVDYTIDDVIDEELMLPLSFHGRHTTVREGYSSWLQALATTGLTAVQEGTGVRITVSSEPPKPLN